MRVIEHSDKHKYTVLMSEDNKWKYFRSYGANYDFNLETGYMASWGRTKNEDPREFPAPNILDLEVTTSCNHNCPFCYKSNNPNGVNMDFETFTKIFDTLPKSITQIAFGADYDLSSNLMVFTMMWYCRVHDVVPNITVGYLDDMRADLVSKLCGAVAVSRYESKDRCYDTVKRLTDRGMKQVNIHYMIAEETYDRALETLKDIKEDPRLEKLNAIVFLSLKKKGRGVGYHTLSQEKFNSLISYARELGVGIGFDSCSSLKAYRAFADKPEVQSSIIPCEASIESSYINVHGQYYPCSFCEGEENESLDWREGISVLECNNSEEFLDKVWFHKKTNEFKEVIKGTCKDNCENCRHCPMFEV